MATCRFAHPRQDGQCKGLPLRQPGPDEKILLDGKLARRPEKGEPAPAVPDHETRRSTMTRILALALFAVLAAGCATTSGVKEEMAPLSARVTTLEQQDAAMQAKLADLSRKADAQSADVQALRKEIANYNAAAQKSAADADAAAVRAETAAAKAAKAFELRQMKGAK
jgi:uncharacterized protein HemX